MIMRYYDIHPGDIRTGAPRYYRVHDDTVEYFSDREAKWVPSAGFVNSSNFPRERFREIYSTDLPGHILASAPVTRKEVICPICDKPLEQGDRLQAQFSDILNCWRIQHLKPVTNPMSSNQGNPSGDLPVGFYRWCDQHGYEMGHITPSVPRLGVPSVEEREVRN